MRKLMAVCIILSVHTSVFASGKADTPKLEVFMGYSHLRNDLPKASFPTVVLDEGMNVWNVSVCQRVNTWLGIVADVSGHYGSEFDEAGFVIQPEKNVREYFYYFLFGPRFYVHTSHRLTPYAQVLFGEARSRGLEVELDIIAAVKSSGFAMAVGGGLDIELSSRVGIRVFEVDYLRSHLFDIRQFGLLIIKLPRQDNVRLSAGIVWRFGKK